MKKEQKKKLKNIAIISIIYLISIGGYFGFKRISERNYIRDNSVLKLKSSVTKVETFETDKKFCIIYFETEDKTFRFSDKYEHSKCGYAVGDELPTYKNGTNYSTKLDNVINIHTPKYDSLSFALAIIASFSGIGLLGYLFYSFNAKAVFIGALVLITVSLLCSSIINLTIPFEFADSEPYEIVDYQEGTTGSNNK